MEMGPKRKRRKRRRTRRKRHLKTHQRPRTDREITNLLSRKAKTSTLKPRPTKYSDAWEPGTNPLSTNSPTISSLATGPMKSRSIRCPESKVRSSK
jgi:hypothetical protein